MYEITKYSRFTISDTLPQNHFLEIPCLYSFWTLDVHIGVKAGNYFTDGFNKTPRCELNENVLLTLKTMSIIQI